MIVSHKHNFIFVHNPKVAGRSFRNALKPFTYSSLRRSFYRRAGKMGWESRLSHTPFWDHISASSIRDVMGADFEKFFVFMAVRNPFSLRLSMYRYFKKLQNHNLEYLRNDPMTVAVSHMKSFEEFVFWDSDFDQIRRPQFSYACSMMGESLLTKTLRFETLETDVADLRSILGLRIFLPHINRSQEDPHSYRSEYSIEMRQKIELDYHLDLEKFEYKF